MSMNINSNPIFRNTQAAAKAADIIRELDGTFSNLARYGVHVDELPPRFADSMAAFHNLLAHCRKSIGR